MKTRSAAKKRGEGRDESSDAESHRSKRRQTRGVGKDKKVVDFDSSAEFDDESDEYIKSDEADLSSYSEAEEERGSSDSSDNEGGKKKEEKGEDGHKRSEEYKPGPKYSLDEVKELLAESGFKEMLEVRAEPSLCRKTLNKQYINFNTIRVLGKDEDKPMEIAKEMFLLFKNPKTDVVGRVRRILDIEFVVVEKKITKVVIQTEVYVTRKELEKVSKDDDDEDEKKSEEDNQDASEVSGAAILKGIVRGLKESKLEKEEVIKVLGAGSKLKAIPLSTLAENVDHLKMVQMCKKSKECQMQKRLSEGEKSLFCLREYDVAAKTLSMIEEKQKEETKKEETEELYKEKPIAGEEEKAGVGKADESDEEKSRAAKRRKSRRNRKAKKGDEDEDSDEKAKGEDDEEDSNASHEDKKAMLEIYDSACHRLELNAVPDYLPCREKEHAEIYEFIKTGIETNGSATSLYISGMPGTGKTATVLEVIKKLDREAANTQIPEFEFIELNGMAIGGIYMVYCCIYQNITGKNASPSQSVLFLDKFFKRKKVDMKGTHKPEVVRVILLDELDGLFTKKQDLLYNIFDWPSYSQARLVIIGIANTMNLPEELQGKIASRIGCRRIVYEPYNREQIQTILETRISQLKLFEQDAVRYVSMKVAALSGDMRRCLQISKRAVEIARAKYAESKASDPIKVNIEHLVSASNELFNSRITALIRCLTKYEILMLAALILERAHAKTDIIKWHRLYDRFESVTQKMGATTIRSTDMDYITTKLMGFGLVSSDDTRCKNLINSSLSVHVFNDELITALEDRKEYKVLIEMIQDAF